MAIDTAERRKSVSGIGFPPLIPGVTPTAVQDQEWRQESGWSYSGILVQPATVVTSTAGLTVAAERAELRSVLGGVNLETILANYAVISPDSVLLCDPSTSSQSFTVGLPPAASNFGRILHIKKVDSSAFTVTIDGDASELIDGAATVVLSSQFQSRTMVCDGFNWHILD